MKKEAEEIAPSMGQRSLGQSVVTTMVRRVVRRPSRVLANFQQLESLFNKVFVFFINSSKNLVFEDRLCYIRHHIIRLYLLVFGFWRFLQVIFGD